MNCNNVNKNTITDNDINQVIDVMNKCEFNGEGCTEPIRELIHQVKKVIPYYAMNENRRNVLNNNPPILTESIGMYNTDGTFSLLKKE